MKTFKALLRSFFWNDDLWMRWMLWACWLNAAYQLTPLAKNPWSVLPAMAVTALGGANIIRQLRRLRRCKNAYKTLQKESAFWVMEMLRLQAELREAEARFATQAEKDEIAARFEVASNRCTREVRVYQKAIQ